MLKTTLIKSLATLISSLILWNIFGWWLFPVSLGLIQSHQMSGEVCCNGAEICCCKSSGSKVCYCLPDEYHDDEKPLFCGIVTQDETTEKEEFVFHNSFDIRAILINNQSSLQPYRFETKSSYCFKKPENGFILPVFKPPIYLKLIS